MQSQLLTIPSGPTNCSQSGHTCHVTSRRKATGTGYKIVSVTRARIGRGLGPLLSHGVSAFLVALAALLGPVQVSHAVAGYLPYELKLVGEGSVWNGQVSDSAYPSERGYSLEPITYVSDLVVPGCVGSIALSAAPGALEAYARLQSSPGPGCTSSEIQAGSEVTDTLRFWATQGNIDEPLRLDLEFDLSESYTYDVEGWPGASTYIAYSLSIDLDQVTQTYSDGRIELGATLGEVYANWSIADETVSNRIENTGKLQLVASDASGEFFPGQKLTLRVTTERGAQVRLQWQLSAHVQFVNSHGPDGSSVGIVETDFGNTLELTSAVVRDPSDESIITDSGLVAESGFDYLAVPEPGRDLLALSAFAAMLALRLAWQRRRRIGPDAPNLSTQ